MSITMTAISEELSDAAEALYDELLPLMQADSPDVYGCKVKAQSAIIAALRSGNGGEVRPLEWVKSNVAERWTAAHPFGSYEIVHNRRDGEFWSPIAGLGRYWNTLAEAQSHIENEHRQAILSALDIKP